MIVPILLWYCYLEVFMRRTPIECPPRGEVNLDDEDTARRIDRRRD
jgi:hypothetical protein